MLRAFLRDGAIYGVLRVLTAGVSVLLLPLYTRAMSPAGYGLVELVTILGVIVTTLATLEIAQGLARHYAIGSSAGERRRYTSTAFWFTVASFSVIIVVTWIFALPLAIVLSGDGSDATALRIAVVAMAGQALLYAVLTGIRYAGRAWSYAAASLTFSLVSIAGALVFVVTLRWGPAGVFGSQLLAAVVALTVACFLARDEIGAVFDRAKCKAMLRFSAPLVVSTLGLFAATYADRLAVRSFLTLEILGVYSVGARVASGVTIVMAAFQMALSPLIYKHHAEPGAPAMIERLFRWFVAASSVPLLLVGVFAAEIVGLAAPGAYAGAAGVIYLLGLGALVANLYLFAPGLWIARRTGTIASINLSMAACSVLGNVMVVPRYGIVGAALVTCTVAFAGFALQLVFAQPSYAVPYHWPRILCAAAILVAFAVADRVAALATLSGWGKGLAFLTGSVLVVGALVRPEEFRTGWQHRPRARVRM